MLINIIGYGYVGSALGHLCKQNAITFCTHDIVRHDEVFALENFNSLREMVQNAESVNVHDGEEACVYFISVPTPNGVNGECDTSIVESIVDELSKYVQKPSYIFIKSTVKPGTMGRINDTFSNREHMTIVYCPEFLREMTFREDMYNAAFALLGTHKGTFDNFAYNVMKVLYSHNKEFNVITKSYEECEMFKYTINVYLSVKVWFFNEVYEVCDKIGVQYEALKELFALDPRLGESHTSVPGPDGRRGFGGKCLPKETKAMCHLQQTLGLPNTILQEILSRNDTLRN